MASDCWICECCLQLFIDPRTADFICNECAGKLRHEFTQTELKLWFDMRMLLEDILDTAEHPLLRSLETGFRHSALTSAEITKRYTETLNGIAADIRWVLNRAPQ